MEDEFVMGRGGTLMYYFSSIHRTIAPVPAANPYGESVTNKMPSQTVPARLPGPGRGVGDNSARELRIITVI